MVDVRVGQKPRAYLGAVEPVEKEMAELQVGFADNVFEGNGFVDLGVVLERIDLVVADESFDGEAVVDIVALVEGFGVGGAEGEVCLDELAYTWIFLLLPLLLIIGDCFWRLELAVR